VRKLQDEYFLAENIAADLVDMLASVLTTPKAQEASAEAAPKCTKCGNPLQEKWKLCPFCGMAVKPEAKPSRMEPVPQPVIESSPQAATVPRVAPRLSSTPTHKQDIRKIIFGGWNIVALILLFLSGTLRYTLGYTFYYSYLLYNVIEIVILGLFKVGILPASIALFVALISANIFRGYFYIIGAFLDYISVFVFDDLVLCTLPLFGIKIRQGIFTIKQAALYLSVLLGGFLFARLLGSIIYHWGFYIGDFIPTFVSYFIGVLILFLISVYFRKKAMKSKS
jgi:hypothetical protein